MKSFRASVGNTNANRTKRDQCNISTEAGIVKNK